MTLQALVGVFLVFAGAIWSVHATNRYAAARYGYAPFSMSNALFMLVPHGLLLYAVSSGREDAGLPVTLAAAGFLGVFLLVRQRSNGWVALYTATMLLAAAGVLVFTIFFVGLAGSGHDEPDPH